MAREVGMSGQRGGHLYMQTNEIRNAVVHHRWSAAFEGANRSRCPAASLATGSLPQAWGPSSRSV